MRICIFSRIMTRHRAHYVPPPVLLIRVFAAMGHEITALTTQMEGGKSGCYTEDQAEVRYLEGTTPGEADDLFWRQSAAEFDRLHKDTPFDLIIGRGNATWGFFKYSRFSGLVPVLCHEGTYPLLVHQLERRAPWLAPVLAGPLAVLWSLFRPAYRQCLIRADRVVCNSPALAEVLGKISWSKPPKTEFIPYGMDLEPFIAASAKAAPASAKRLVFVGRLTWDKGVLAMIEILAKLKDRKAVLEAIGPASKKVKAAMLKRATDLGVQDRLLLPGPVHNSLLPERLAGANLFLFPSTHPEGLNKTVMEAMCAGLPVVAYQMPGMEILIETGKTGWLVPTRDTSAAAARVDALLADPELGAKMGLAGQKRIASDFAPQPVIAQWDKVMAEVVSADRSESR
jgi:glycosyltransferase involved in cell wall biosynthesis